MRLLVTGGCGFIGSNFIRYWLKSHPEDEIVNLDKLTYAGHLESLKDIKKDPRHTFMKGDIVNPEDVERAIQGVDTVVHFAAASHVDRSIIDPMLFIKTNLLGTGVLLQAALSHGIKRFHHVSSDEVFGELGLADLPFDENSAYKPRTPYAASKAGSDMLVRSYFHTYNLPITISNCANNFGSYQDPEKLIPRFITNLLDGKKVPLMGRGENIRTWLYVQDHCRALDIIIKKGNFGATYCIGGEEKTNLEVTKKILQLLGKDESFIEYVKHRLGHDFRYALDSTKIEKLGWKPKHDFGTCLKKTVEWYKENEWWWKPLKQGRPVVDRAAQKGYAPMK